MIFAYRNVDSPNGDFGLVKQEGDERFVVLTKAEYAALCPVTSPGAHGEGEAVTLWKYRDSHVFRRSQPRSYRYGIDEEFKALPAAAFDALVASRKDAEESVEAMTHVLSERIAEMAANAALLARANTAKVAAELMRARAERAEARVCQLDRALRHIRASANYSLRCQIDEALRETHDAR